MRVRSVGELIEALAQGERVKYVFFWGGKRREGEEVGRECLSQWYDAGFEVSRTWYATTEHWMMAQKARLFEDDEMLQQILDAPNPGKAKALGRKVRGFVESVWHEHRFELVTQGNVHKFDQNPELLDFLLDTGDRVLMEASPRDRIWGVGLGEGNAAVREPHRWRGLNLLGFALMEARERLRAGQGA